MDMLKIDKPAGPPESETAAKWRKWLERINARKKVFEEGWWKLADAAQAMYDLKKGANYEECAFNILFANTEVLLPSLYSASPRPDVGMRNKQAQDPVAHAAEAYLTTFIDMNVPGRETFDDSTEAAVLSALVPGMGFVRLRAYPGEGCAVRTEHGTYKELLWGKANRWPKVPWIAFIHAMVKEDIVKQFNLTEETAKRLNIQTQAEADESRDPKDKDSFFVYELWIREGRQVVWLCDGYEDILLEEMGDKLNLQSFYPTPGPLTLVKKPGTLDPTPLYEYYRNQAEELNRVTVRLYKVLHAIRVRGAYNNLLGKELANILNDTNTENGLVPSANAIDLNGKGFEGHVWLLPIEQLIVVAKELYSARVQIMSVIQQITGLSDIVRGSTVASETATAQDLKNKWGTIRLRRMQRIVQLYVRDLLRMAIDLAASIMKEQEWQATTQLEIPTTEEKGMATQALQSTLFEYQKQAALVQSSGGQPPPPPQPDPKMVAAASSPSWGDILKTLQSDNGRSYTIDIETASTIDTDATADREETSDFLGAMAQFVAAAAPLVQLGQSGMEVVKEMLIAVCSKFKFGRELKQSIEKLQAPPPGQGDPAAQAKAQAVQQQITLDKQKHDQQMAMDQQKAQNQANVDAQLNTFKIQQAQRDEVLAQKKMEVEMAKLAFEQQKLPIELEILNAKAAAARSQAKNAARPPASASKKAT